MIIQVDSFDHYNDGDIVYKWDDNVGCSISATGGRCGTAGLFNNGAAGAGIKKAIPSAATYIFGFALFLPALPTPSGDFILCSFLENTTKHVDIIVQSDGRIAARRAGTTTLGTSTNFLSAGQYNYIEIKVTIDNSAGVVTVKVNGTSTGWLALTSQDTQNGGTAAITNWILGGDLLSNQLGVDSYFDDVVVLDTTGAVNNDFLGDCRVEAIFPSGAGNYAAWTPSAGSNYQNTDESPSDDDATYNSSTTATAKDSFAFDNLSVTSGTVKAVAINMWARKDESGSRSITGLMRLSGVDAFGSAKLIGNTFQDYVTIMEADPSAGALSIADVNAAEFGYRLES